MSQKGDAKARVRMQAYLLWFLFLSFLLYVFLTAVLILPRGGGIRFTLFFEDFFGNIFGVVLVLIYLLGGLPMTYYFYKRSLRTEPEMAYFYAIAPVIVGVAAPYIYALLLSFMGIMRDILPIFFVGLLYIMGIMVGLLIIPKLTAHLKST